MFQESTHRLLRRLTPDLGCVGGRRLRTTPATLKTKLGAREPFLLRGAGVLVTVTDGRPPDADASGKLPALSGLPAKPDRGRGRASIPIRFCSFSHIVFNSGKRFIRGRRAKPSTPQIRN